MAQLVKHATLDLSSGLQLGVVISSPMLHSARCEACLNDGWMDGWKDGWMGGWMDGWMEGWMDDGWIAGWMDGWVDGHISCLVGN